MARTTARRAAARRHRRRGSSSSRSWSSRAPVRRHERRGQRAEAGGHAVDDLAGVDEPLDDGPGLGDAGSSVGVQRDVRSPPSHALRRPRWSARRPSGRQAPDWPSALMASARRASGCARRARGRPRWRARSRRRHGARRPCPDRVVRTRSSFWAARSRAIGDDDHARVLAVADARAAAVVDAHPGGARRGVDERVQQAASPRWRPSRRASPRSRGSARPPSPRRDGRGR